MPPQDRQTYSDHAQAISPWTEPFRTTFDNQTVQPRPESGNASHPEAKPVTYDPLSEAYNPAR